MSDSDPGAGNLCNFIFSKKTFRAGLIYNVPFLRAYD